jgi:hypothetical protein
MMRIFTSRWSEKSLKDRPDLLKVGVSLGEPKWPLPYKHVSCRLLNPLPIALKLPDGEARMSFLEKMQRVGVSRVKEEFKKIEEASGGMDIVLLCWENVWKGEGCHRRWFAEWWEKETGEIIEELPEVATAPIPVVESLF